MRFNLHPGTVDRLRDRRHPAARTARAVAVSVLSLAAAAVLAGQPAAAQTDTNLIDYTTDRDLIVSDMAPGDSHQWTGYVTNVTDQPLEVTMTFTPTQDNALTTDTVNGLQITIDTCNQAWADNPNLVTTPTTADPNLEHGAYVCTDTETRIAQAPAADILPSGHVFTLPAHDTWHLRTHVHFPTTADNTFENLDTDLTIQFTTAYEEVPPTPPEERPDGPTESVTPPGDDGGGPRGPLSRTGAETIMLVSIGAAFISVGAVLVKLFRRRTTAPIQ